MNNAQRALLIAAGLFLTIALITIVVNLFGSATEATKQAQNEFSSMQYELSSAAFDQYENGMQTGSQVKAAIRKYGDREDFGIQVITGKNQASSNQGGSWYGNTINIAKGIEDESYGTVHDVAQGKIVLAENELHNDYINPNGQFKAQIIRDKNNVIRGIVFTQKYYKKSPSK